MFLNEGNRHIKKYRKESFRHPQNPSGPYWYFTKHGVGVGSIPKDISVYVTMEGKNKKGTWGEFFASNKVLNTNELLEFDIEELVPNYIPNDISKKIEKEIEFDKDHVKNEKYMVESINDYPFDNGTGSRYTATSYLSPNYRGVMSDTYSDNIDDIKDWAWNQICAGESVVVTDSKTGDYIRINTNDVNFSDDYPYGVVDDMFNAFLEINENLDTDSGNENWEIMDKKYVNDSDGFTTEYTWYYNNNSGEHIFIFGDSDIYGPEDGDIDWECDSFKEAEEWFYNYSGIDD